MYVNMLMNIRLIHYSDNRNMIFIQQIFLIAIVHFIQHFFVPFRIVHSHNESRTCSRGMIATYLCIITMNISLNAITENLFFLS